MKKSSTGIKGLDTILYGGYLTGKPTLISGDPGTGKTIITLLYANSVLLNSESILYISFDERPSDLIKHMQGLDLQGQNLASDKLFFIDASQNYAEYLSGSFDMMALISRAVSLIEKHKINHLIVDSIQSIDFGKARYMPSAELLTLFEYARQKNITLLATLGEGILDKNELIIKFSVDCVIQLRQVVSRTIMTRFLRVLKCRGSKHGTNLYSFSIHSKGISILPITSSKLSYESASKYISTGIKQLDHILGAKGIPLGAIIMISGRSGTAKTSLAAKIAESACQSGLNVWFLSLEQSPSDLIKQMESPNIKLKPYVNNKKLFVNAIRSVEQGLEEHILSIINFIEENDIDMIIIDPVTAFMDIGEIQVVKNILLRFSSYVKEHGKTVVFTELIPENSGESSFLSISSLTDIWIRLRLIEEDGEFYRALNVVKARGMAQSHQVKELKLSNKGIELLDPYISNGQIVFGAKKSILEMMDNLAQSDLSQAEMKLDQEIKLLQDKKKILQKKQKLHLGQKKAYSKSRE
jgi:circadian clock protein KaiC